MLCELIRITSAILMSTLNIQLFCRKSKKKKIPKLSPFASWLSTIINPQGSNHPCLEQFSVVPKMFEPSKFDCTKAPWYFVHAQDDMNLHILHMFNGTFLLDITHLTLLR